jgi:hypothetical protein
MVTMRNQGLVLPTSVARPRRGEYPNATLGTQHHHDLVAGRYDSAKFSKARRRGRLVRTASPLPRRRQSDRATRSRDMNHTQVFAWCGHAAMPRFGAGLSAVRIVKEAGSVLGASFLRRCNIPAGDFLNTNLSPSRT